MYQTWNYLLYCSLGIKSFLSRHYYHLSCHQKTTPCIIIVHPINHNNYYRIINCLCALFMSWLTLQTTISDLLMYTVIFLWFCWTSMIFSISNLFIYILLCMVHPMKSFTIIDEAHSDWIFKSCPCIMSKSQWNKRFQPQENEI